MVFHSPQTSILIIPREELEPKPPKEQLKNLSKNITKNLDSIFIITNLFLNLLLKSNLKD